MSELITRRTFLKAAGTAMAAAAAGGMLAGCGNGEYGATPGSPTLPAIDSSTYADFGSFTVDLGPVNTDPFNKFFSGSFTITVKVGNTSRVFDYSGGLINDPSVSNH